MNAKCNKKMCSKKITSWLLTLVMSLTLFGTNALPVFAAGGGFGADSGDGLSEEHPILIEDQDDFLKMESSGKYYKLANDITCQASQSNPVDYGTNPVMCFKEEVWHMPY